MPYEHWIGDHGICDSYPYNTPQCGWDGGDCHVKYPNCTETIDFTFGDGNCTQKYNTTECGFDDGDCMMNYTGNSTGYYDTRTLGSISIQHVFERVLNYFFSHKEEEKLEWQK